MSRVFLDTVGLIAILDNADQWHAAAERAYLQLTARRVEFFTTSFVFLECGNAAARRPYRRHVSKLRDAFEQRRELIVPTENDWLAAWNAYDCGDAAQAGIVDQVSFVVMRRLGILEAFTNDQHFTAAGFRLLF